MNSPVLSAERLNHYLCYILNRREETEEEIEAASSFEARKIKAEQFSVDLTDVVSIRLS